MPKEIPLDESIVATLTGICSSDEAAAVHAEAERVLRDLTTQADAADVASLSPLATAAEARKLRDQAAERRFEADRMEASVSALSARVADLRDAEREARRDAERSRVLDIRDKLAADIADRYPRIVGDLTDIVKRVIECDELCRRNGIHESAEAMGRKCPSNFYIGGGPVSRLIDVRLPMPSSADLAWGQHTVGGEYRFPGLALAAEQETNDARL